MPASARKHAPPPPSLELVLPAEQTQQREPEQLPLIRMLEVVRDRVDSIHAGQRVLTEQLKDLRESLPMQRRPLSARTQGIHIQVTASRRNGICPCCQQVQVCTPTERLPGAEFDHWYGRNQARPTQTWLICAACNAALNDTEFKAAARSSFEAYQQALRPFLGGRQMALLVGQ